MVQVNIHEAKTTLSALLLKVEKKGELVRICRDGKAIAELRPISKKKNPLKTNPKLKAKIIENPMEPLDPADWIESEENEA